MSHEFLLGTALAVSAVFLFFSARKRKRSVYPPGPRPWPVLGNVTDFQSKELWARTKEWADVYGEITYLHVLGQSVIFLNSQRVATALLDGRGSLYSDKPRVVMAGELCGCENMVPFVRYGDQFRRQRRLMHKTLGPRAIGSYHPYLLSQTKVFLHELAGSPSEYMRHSRKYAGGLTLSVIYGYQPRTYDDGMLKLAEDCLQILANDIAAGSKVWPVDVIPALKYIPTWLPGSDFKRKAQKWRVEMERFVEEPFQYVKECLKHGTATPSFCEKLLTGDEKLSSDEEFDAKWAGNSMYAASADTTVTTISHFLLAMQLYPDVLKKAQAELDSVIGDDRLPTFEDRAHLPYVEAVFSEVWRWGVPAPLNLPHSILQDDVFEGYIIPKGSLIIANIWNMLRDESLYPNADEFDPERFLNVEKSVKEKRDPRNFIFGFGRRRCPGADLVEDSIWLLIASMLSALDISRGLDVSGKPVDPVVEFNNSFFRTPDPFSCKITARFPKNLSIS